MDCVRIGLIGLGVVGCGVINLLSKRGRMLAERSGVELRITRAAAKGFSKKRGADLVGIALCTDPFEVVRAGDVDIVIEVMGGESPALELILEAVKNGKSVVTANKRLLAIHGEKIYKAVEDAGVELGFEAAVAGAVPIIRSIREAFAANKIEAVHGIINGTSNYILSRMTEEGKPFAEILEDAQDLGYAEADPTFDVEGTDSAHKIAVLAALAFETPVDFAGVYTEGISKITPEDIGMAKEFGYTIKLLAIAKRVNDSIDVRVHPAMIPSGHPMANVNGPLNAVEVIGDFCGVNMLVGPGAGAGPTASAVMGDALDIASSIARGTTGKRPPLMAPYALRKKIKMRPIGEARSRYYIRFSVPDKPGVLAQLAGALGENGISIASMIQRGREENQPVSVVMTTHTAVESDLRKALAKVDALRVNAAPAMVIRMEGE